MSNALGARHRLAKLMNSSRIQQRTTWDEIARRGGTSVATLRRIRTDTEYPMTEEAMYALEVGMHWPERSIERVLNDPEYVPPVLNRAATPALTEERIRTGDVTPAEAMALFASLERLGEREFWDGVEALVVAHKTLQAATRTA